jgi:mRNA-degrading endonuclease RelE of RelBE toxin-antitoxin system
LLSEEAYRLAQVALAMNPEMGATMKACGGAQKVRWGAKGRGKSGGVRTIYYWAAKEETICLC